MTLQLPASVHRSEFRWVKPAPGLWVGTRRGLDAGMIERLDGMYHVRNPDGHALGSFPDLDSAFAAVDGGVQETEHWTAPRGMRTLLWIINGAAAVAAVVLALALLLR